MSNNSIPFPQADDFKKIIKIINIDDSALLKDTSYLCAFLGDVTERQVSYYLAACDYIGITKKREFTSFGKQLRELSEKKQYVKLAQEIFQEDLFSEIYFIEKVYGMKLGLEEIINLMKEKVNLNTEEMYKRRAQTVSSWIDWFNLILNDIFEE